MEFAEIRIISIAHMRFCWEIKKKGGNLDAKHYTSRSHARTQFRFYNTRWPTFCSTRKNITRMEYYIYYTILYLFLFAVVILKWDYRRKITENGHRERVKIFLRRTIHSVYFPRHGLWRNCCRTVSICTLRNISNNNYTF